MNDGKSKSSKPRHHEVALRLDSLKQFFNSMDPSPFYEKDLDPDAEHYIVSLAEEFPLAESVSLVLHLDAPDTTETSAIIEEAVHNHFRNLARLSRLEFRHMMRVGSRSLVIGLAVLTSCLLLSELIAKQDGALMEILRQSLLIGGWVAMWQPMQTYLYGWWPLRRRRLIYEKLRRMPVHLRPVHHPDSAHPASNR